MRLAAVAAGALALAAMGCRRPPAPAETLEQILLGRNDNDPRLDTAFNDLSSQDRLQFRVRYRELAPERRNERGTIVYLLGKNLREPKDWDFLREVVVEPPCLSLSDCGKPPAGAAEAGDAVTLAYPALVALRQAQGVGGLPARAVVAAAKSSRSPTVRRAAARIDELMSKRKRP